MNQTFLDQLLSRPEFFMVLAAFGLIVYLQRGLSDESAIELLARPGWGLAAGGVAVFLFLMGPDDRFDPRIWGAVLGVLGAFSITALVLPSGIRRWLVSREHLGAVGAIALAVVIAVAFVLPAMSNPLYWVIGLIVIALLGGLYLINKSRPVRNGNGNGRYARRPETVVDGTVTSEQADRLIEEIQLLRSDLQRVYTKLEINYPD